MSGVFEVKRKIRLEYGVKYGRKTAERKRRDFPLEIHTRVEDSLFLRIASKVSDRSRLQWSKYTGGSEEALRVASEPVRGIDAP